MGGASRLIKRIVLFAIAALAVIGTLTVSTIIAVVVYFIWFYDDPFATDISRSEARQAVALELCPQDPDSVLEDIVATLDSGYWYVSIGDRPILFTVQEVKASSRLRVDAADKPSQAYLEETRSLCSRLSTPSPTPP